MHNLIVVIFLLSAMTYLSCYKLKQVLILSRHNIRTPISDDLYTISPKQWPQWGHEAGKLTHKGATLEGYMGKYFALWLKKEGLLNNSCPDEDTFYAYTNNFQRTKASARSFIGNAFPNCDIKLNHAKDKKIDLKFLPVIRNSSDAFKATATKEMLTKLQDLDLESSFTLLQDILDFKNSEMCKKGHICDLVNDVSSIVNVCEGYAPEIIGSLHTGTLAVDSFLMAYYEGYPQKHVAWGKIKNAKQWNKLTSIVKAYNNVRFNTMSIAKDISKPLIQLMREKLNNGTKITFLMGHDANLITVGTVLGLNDYILPNQHESTPIGGKMVFQKWLDEKKNQNLLKINYVYQSSEQLRNRCVLDAKNPPCSVILSLKNCPVDKHGYAQWDDFMKILHDAETP